MAMLACGYLLLSSDHTNRLNHYLDSWWFKSVNATVDVLIPWNTKTTVGGCLRMGTRADIHPSGTPAGLG